MGTLKILILPYLTAWNLDLLHCFTSKPSFWASNIKSSSRSSLSSNLVFSSDCGWISIQRNLEPPTSSCCTTHSRPWSLFSVTFNQWPRHFFSSAQTLEASNSTSLVDPTFDPNNPGPISSTMYSCANYPRGCRGRVNRQGAKCSDCVVCAKWYLCLVYAKINERQRKTIQTNPIPVSKLAPSSFAVRPTTRVQARTSLGTLWRAL